MIAPYSKAKKHLLEVECVTLGFNEEGLKILLLKNKNLTEHGKWSLLGDFVGEKESPDETAKRVLKHQTGSDAIYFEQLATYGEVKRDPEARVIAIAYLSLVRLKDSKPAAESQWLSLNAPLQLVLDHSLMVKAARKKIQDVSLFKRVATKLLADHFSLLQLQHLYESIHQKKIDKRNFHKWILALGILKKLTIKDKSTSKKGTYLYEFTKTKKQEVIVRKQAFT